MGIRDKGYTFWPNDEKNELVSLVIIDNFSKQRQEIYQPTEDDVRKVCEENNLDFIRTIDMIREKDPNVHTMVIDVLLYRAYLETSDG